MQLPAELTQGIDQLTAEFHIWNWRRPLRNLPLNIVVGERDDRTSTSRT